MSRRRLLALAVPLLLVVCAGLYAAARGRPSPPRPAGQNVLLVTIDTLRADALGSYGDRSAATPVLDRLAQAGVRFEQARAHNVVTLPSHANILSGRYPFQHGLRDNAGYRFPANLDTIATLLKARGYRTGAFVSAFPLDSRFGLDRGFDLYDDRLGDPESVASFRMTERRGPETVAAARHFVAAEPGRPWFCWVHLYEPHAPYEPPGSLAARFSNAPYKGEVAAADEALGALLEPLLAAGAEGRTLVVVTSDHGESLGEHGETTHGVFAYEATLRVPLIVFAPALFGPRVVADAVRHVDILPTVMDALGVPLPPDLPGRSLLPLAAGEPQAPASSYFEALTAAANRGWAPLHGVVRDERKYIDLPLPELYDLRSDPAEQANLVASRPEGVLALRSLLSSLLVEPERPERQAESAETRERLRSLGYLTASAAPKSGLTDADDPKRLIVHERRLDQLLARQAEGDQGGAREVGRDLLRAQPDSPLVLMHVAALEHDAGQQGRAISLLEHALQVSPEEPQVAALLGRYLAEAGRPAEAIKRLRRPTDRSTPDVDVLMALGAALAQTGSRAEALRVLTRAQAIDPTNALCWLNLGTVHLMAGKLDEAKAAFEAALEHEPTLARAYTSLGVVEARAKHTDAALRHWRRALELNPAEYDALFNAGTFLLEAGRREEAVSFLARFAREAPPARYPLDIREVKRLLGRTGSGRG
jgi:arylsulfatase A-like enzyme/Tfp pilus assembly protein PilF